jgi:hypothetical protein
MSCSGSPSTETDNPTVETDADADTDTDTDMTRIVVGRLVRTSASQIKTASMYSRRPGLLIQTV